MRKKQKDISNSQTKDKDKKILFRRTLITAGTLGVSLTVLMLLRNNAAVAEWMTRTVSRAIVYCTGHVTSVLPISFFEWFVILAIAGLLFFLTVEIVRLCRKKFKKALKSFLSVTVAVLIAANVYMLSAGFVYYRAPLELPMSGTVYKGEDATAVSQYFLQDFCELEQRMTRDANGNVISPYTNDGLARLLQKEYERLGDYYFSYTPRAKSMVNSWYMSSTCYSGVSFLPLGEANVNTIMPQSAIPHTMAHELAHTKGVMRENEANLVAYYLLLTSEDDYLRYCGYFFLIGDIASISMLGNNCDYEYFTALYDDVPASYKAEKSNYNNYWFEYKGPFSFIGDGFTAAVDWVYNLYLKASGIDEGLSGGYDNPWGSVDTGEIDPDTEKPIIEPIYSNIHKILFAIYESK